MMPLVKPWSEADIERLRVMAAAGASPIKCAAALRRNVQAIRRQASRLGIHLPTLREQRKRLREAEAEAAQ
ncbi:hypothetical protein [Tardiphaga sp.]|jgi:GcrA cell cycle regulator|uniref:hypothetical protein n=1 Tax=Tardiphaga sp. TaxID=1926292 RepID=UPI0037D9A068